MYRLINILIFLIRKSRLNQSGATAIEYGLIVGLMAAIVVSVLGIFGDKLEVLFHAIATKLGETATTLGDQ